jgi:hypothetical protein
MTCVVITYDSGMAAWIPRHCDFVGAQLEPDLAFLSYEKAIDGFMAAPIISLARVASVLQTSSGRC